MFLSKALQSLLVLSAEASCFCYYYILWLLNQIDSVFDSRSFAEDPELAGDREPESQSSNFLLARPDRFQ